MRSHRNNPTTIALTRLCLAVSAINNCELCVQTHERAILETGMSEQNVIDAVRIAATIHAAAVTLEAVATDAAGL